jgi:hypothetical protein
MTTTATQLAAMLDHGHPLAEEAQQAAAELRRLTAEVEALRKDAERYRWLRDEAWGGNNKRGPHLVEFKPGHTPSFFTELAEQAADAAIDAAMKGAANG